MRRRHLEMAGLDGWDATRRHNANPLMAGIPVIGLTAQAMKGVDERAPAAGGDGDRSKPLDVQTLIALLRERLT